MSTDPITLQKLIDASTDADTYGDVVNGPANINGTGLVPSRTGGDKKTLAKLEAEFQAKIAGQTVQEQLATAEAVRAEAAAEAASLSASSLSPADILYIDAGVAIPKAPRFITSANRLKRVGQCHWAKCAANEARVYYGNSGAIEGVLFDGAETIKGADFTTAPPDSTAGQHVSLGFGTGHTVGQVGAHSEPDIFGGTGKMVRVYGGTASSGQFRFSNLSQSLVSGDRVRFSLLVCFHNPGTGFNLNLAPFAVSGTGISGNNAFAVAADGTITTVAAATRGVDLFDTDAAGRKWYRIWANYTSTGTGVFAPLLIVPSPFVGVAMAWSIKNPTQAVPTAVPVLADAAFAADAIQLGTDQPLEVEWSQLCVGRTRINDGLLVPPRDAAAMPVPVEKRIAVRAATEVAEVAYSLPGPRMGLLFPNSGAQTVRLGPGVWDHFFQISAATSYDIQGAYSDPKRWGILRALRMSGGTLTSVNIDKVAFWLRTPVGPTNNVSTASSQFILQIEIDPDNVTLGDILIVGAALEWSQYLIPADQAIPPEQISRFAGRFNVAVSTSGTLNFGKIKARKCSVGMTVSATTGSTLNIVGEGLASELLSTDHFNIGGVGTSNITLGHWACGKFAPGPANFFQTQHEIEVDVGAGYVPYSASGLTPATMPAWHRMIQYGTHAGGVIAPNPKPENVFYVTNWLYNAGLGTNIDKPGFQFRGPNAIYGDPETGEELYRSEDPGNNTVWVSDDVGTPSPTNPRIRLRITFVQWTSASTFTATSGRLSAGAGSHGDYLQLIGDSPWSFNCQNIVWLGAGAQGFFGPAGAICSAFSARGFFGHDGVTVNLINGAGPLTLSGLMAAPFTPERNLFGQQTMPLPTVTAGTSFDLGGLYISTNSNNAAGLGAINGTLVAPPTPVATSRVNANVVIPARTDQPSANNYLDFFIPPNLLRDGKIDATIDTLSFTGYALEKLPYLKEVLSTVRAGAWGFFKELEEICEIGLPTHDTAIANSAAIGTSLTLTVRDEEGRTELAGSRIIEGDPRELFTIEGGVLKTAALLRDAYGAALVDNLALVTDAGERISVKVTA